MFSLPNVFFVILITLATAYVTFLTTKGGLTDNRRKWWKRLTNRGRLAALIFICIIGLGTWQELSLEWKGDRLKIESERKDAVIMHEKETKDSTIAAGIKTGVEINRKILFEDLSKAFAKQEFGLDTVKQEIYRIRDSARTVINNYSQPDPILTVDTIYFKEKNKIGGNYQIVYRCYNAGSTNFDIKMYALFQYPDGTIEYATSGIAIPKMLHLGKDTWWESGFTIAANKKINIIFVYLKGGYTTLDGLKSYQIDELVAYDLENPRVEFPNNQYRDRILKYIPN